MNGVLLLLIGLFLPLFPLSMAINALLARIRQPLFRAVLLLLWPQLGLLLLSVLPETVMPHWLAPLALFTAALYAYRAIAARELGQWSGYLATSLWALIWLFVMQSDSSVASVHLHTLGFSLPLVLLTLLGHSIERRFGAVYTGLCSGLAQSMPRLSGALVLIVLGVIATPLFPSFFSMTQLIFLELPASPLFASILLVVWLLWTWSGVRLLQGLVIGPMDKAMLTRDIQDISVPVAWGYVVLLVALSAGSLLILEVSK